MSHAYRSGFKTVYHGTSKAALASILKEGLIPRKSDGADSWAAEVQGKRFRDTASQQGVYLTTLPGIAATFSQLAAQAAAHVAEYGHKLIEGGVVLELDLFEADPALIEPDHQFNALDDEDVRALVYRGPLPARCIKSYREVHPTGDSLPSFEDVESIERPPLALGDPVAVAA